MSDTFIHVESSIDCYEPGDGDIEHTTTILETPEQWLKAFIQAGILRTFLIEAIKDPHVVTMLASLGYHDVKLVKKTLGDIKRLPEFFVSDRWNKINSVDVTSLNRFDVDRFIAEGHLLQKIDPECLKEINPKAYEAFQKGLRRKKAAEARKRKTANDRAAKKKQKEIEKAKKLLEDAGEL